ncbi:hypothetical protein ASPU41_16710 [Arthrobacter sp. U41]|nr:hypothetical protein ASPU41_16710 [Arthrobacter sp. U41]
MVAVVLVLVMFSRGPGNTACPAIGYAGPGNTACPAIGYAYVGDVELIFPQEPVSVAACFEEGCTPAAVTKNPDGKWLVPQSKPYLVPPVSVTSVYVETEASSGARIARALPIVTEPTGEYPYGRKCGGPVRFKPVQVPLG